MDPDFADPNNFDPKHRPYDTCRSGHSLHCVGSAPSVNPRRKYEYHEAKLATRTGNLCNDSGDAVAEYYCCATESARCSPTASRFGAGEFHSSTKSTRCYRSDSGGPECWSPGEKRIFA